MPAALAMGGGGGIAQSFEQLPGLRRGQVAHEPYSLCHAELTRWDENLLQLDGFALTGRSPDHIVMSRGVDVTIYPLERVGGG
jgi:hypothetical protein